MNSFKLIQTLSLSSLLTVSALTIVPNQVQAGEKNSASIGLKQNSSQSVVYVHPTQGIDSPNSGSSVERPFRTISYALMSAKSGTEIRLTEGVYDNEQFPLKVPDGVRLMGNSSNKGDNIKIMGGGDHITKTFGLQNIAIVLGDGSELIGVSVTNPNNRGTGVWIESGKPLVSNSSFIDNNREGVFVSGSAAPNIEDSIFKNNTGNGIGLDRQAKGQIRKNLFDNTGFGLSMGGDVAPFVSQNTIINNNSGIVLTQNAQPTLQGNTIKNNRDYGIIATGKANPQVNSDNNIANNGDDSYMVATKTSTPNPPPTQTPNPIITDIASNGNTYSDKVSFECVPIKGGYATVVQKDNPGVLPRQMIDWRRQIGSQYTPEKRCQLVTDKLNTLVTQNGGKIDNLNFATGSVNNTTVICLANSSSLGCNSSNMLFTLSAQNAKMLAEVINALATNLGSSSGAGSSPVQESNGNAYASLKPLNDQLQPELGLWFTNY